MIVDDSVVIRGMISRWISAEPDMQVAASLRTDLDAVNQIDRIKPDVVVLDIEMPDLDGISWRCRNCWQRSADLIIIMASTLTCRNAEISFKALSSLAQRRIPKPESTQEAGAAGAVPPRPDPEDPSPRRQGLPAAAPSSASPPLAPALDRQREAAVRPQAALLQQVRRLQHADAAVLLIGSSTGGPQALMTLVAGIAPASIVFP